MQLPERPKHKSQDLSKGARKALAVRLDRAAQDLNPFLVVLAIGLLILNLTIYIGMAAAGQPFARTPPHQASSHMPPAAATTAPELANLRR